MKQIFILAISVAVLISCKDDSKTTEVEKTTEIEQVETTSTDAIQLNNGEKWAVNEDMKPFIIKSEEAVALYIKNNGTDYKKLAQDIKDQNNLLIKSCTMKGASHDELHKWLHPHLDLVNQLAEIDNNDKANALITEIDASYKMYHTYFN